MKLINSSSVLLAAVALSSMTDRASAQSAMPSIEEVLAMISGGQVQGTGQPEEEPQPSSIVADTAPVRPIVAEEEEPQIYVAPEIENFSSAVGSDVEADNIMIVSPEPMPVPSAAPSAPPKPITCIDRSLEVTRSGPTGVKCIKRDEAICRGDWMFGIVPSVMDGTYQVTAWEWDAMMGYTDIAFAAYDGAEELCVGKTRRDKGYTSFMYIKTESDGTYYLVCNGVGKLDKNPKLKIRVRQDKEKRRKKNKRDMDFYDTIVKFRRGANDDDTLWSANTDGSQSANEKCYWKKMDEPTPENPIEPEPEPMPMPLPSSP